MEGYGTDIGVSPRAIDEVFNVINGCTEDWSYTVTISIYLRRSHHCRLPLAVWKSTMRAFVIFLITVVQKISWMCDKLRKEIQFLDSPRFRYRIYHQLFLILFPIAP